MLSKVSTIVDRLRPVTGFMGINNIILYPDSCDYMRINMRYGGSVTIPSRDINKAIDMYDNIHELDHRKYYPHYVYNDDGSLGGGVTLAHVEGKKKFH